MIRARTILALALVAAILPATVHARAKHHPLEGAWRLIGTLSGPDGALVPNAPGFEEYKLVGDDYFMWTSIQDGKIFGNGGGAATLGDDTYTERLDYADDRLSGLVGNSLAFHWKIVDGRWYHTGTGHGTSGAATHLGGRLIRLQMGEVWERVPKPSRDRSTSL